MHPNQDSTWKRQAMDGLGAVVSNGADKSRVDHKDEVHDRHAKIGQLTVERDYLARGLKLRPGGTSEPHPAHRIYPYLPRQLTINRVNQVWCAYITYIPVQRGFLYLATIMDCVTRHVLAWRLSNTLEAEFCVEAPNENLVRFGPPDIINTDQGSQFTSWAWTNRLRQTGVKISIEGKGRFLDNILVKRLWCSLKYECAYLHA